MPLDRITVLDQTLRSAGIPIDGVSSSGPPYPAGVTIQYLPAATVEQRAAGTQIKETFDYRPRRSLTRAAIVTQIAALTTAQQTQLLRHLLAFLLRSNDSEAGDILTASGLPVAVDEIDPGN
jgi:hypothetical protein